MILFCYTAPEAPKNLSIMLEEINLIATVTFYSSHDVAEAIRPDYYELSVVPDPVMLLPSKNHSNNNFRFLITDSTDYNITVSSVNCGGRRSASLLFGKEFASFLIFPPCAWAVPIRASFNR